MFRNKKYKASRKNAGQSTVEYIILVTAVIGAVIIFMSGRNSIFQTRVNNTFNQVTSDMTDKARDLASSHTAAAFDASSQVSVAAATAKPF